MKTLSRLDTALFALLTLYLLVVVVVSGMANLQTDSIDYYAIVQRLVGDEPPIMSSLPFVEQRSPGYPLLTLPLYFILGGTPAVEAQPAPRPVSISPVGDAPHTSEATLLPPTPLKVRDIFFKDFDLQPMGGILRWRILAAMLLTGYALFFGGLFISARTLAMLYPAMPGYSLAPLTVVTSMVFMHNIVKTPAYATLTVFGISCFLTYFWVKGWQSGSMSSQWAAGLFAGLMVLTRLETVLVVIALLIALLFQRQLRFVRNFVLGVLLPLILLLVYNTTQFGNPFHAGILKGDMNQIAFELSYVWDVLSGPKSGILFYSTLTSLGIIGLFLTRTESLRALGWASLVLIVLIAVRVPVMYYCIGKGIQSVGGIDIICPADNSAMLALIRLDANRYIIPLIPFAVLGLRELIDKKTPLNGLCWIENIRK